MGKKIIMVFAVVVLIVILIIAVGFSDFFDDKKKDADETGIDINYTVLIDDFDYAITSLKSYNEGDLLNIQGTIVNVSYYPNAEPSAITYVYINSEDLFPMAFFGDKRSEYSIGDNVVISTEVKAYVLMEKVLLIEEWYNYYISSLIPIDDKEDALVAVELTTNNTFKITLTEGGQNYNSVSGYHPNNFSFYINSDEVTGDFVPWFVDDIFEIDYSAEGPILATDILTGFPIGDYEITITVLGSVVHLSIINVS